MQYNVIIKHIDEYIMNRRVYMRKVIVVLLCICLIITSGLAVPIKATAAIDNTDVNINASIPLQIIKAGDSIDIKVDATVNDKKLKKFIYSSNNKKVATVSNSGRIKAISAGECEITVYPKEYKDDYTYVRLRVVDRIIKITGSDKYEAGNIYQLKASEKNVIWNMTNLDGNARASIDPNSGKIKIRCAGEIYISCTSKDGKGLGAVYINATGPIIEDKAYEIDTITITEDEHISSFRELRASGKLPNKMKVPYTDGTKKGTVEVSILWDSYFNQEYKVKSYIIYGEIMAPDGYQVPGGGFNLTNVKAKIDIKIAQTDTRKKIISIEALNPINITDDEHIGQYWDVVEKHLQNIQLKCTLEDGSIIELPIGSVSYKKDIDGKGTYQCELNPEIPAGYYTDEDEEPSAKLVVKITKKQTYTEWVNSIDTIAQDSMVYEYVSQKPLSK